MTSKLEVKKSITVYLYNTISKIYSHSITTNMSVFMENVIEGFDFTLTPPPDYVHVWRWVDTKWVELLPINNPDKPFDDVSVWNEQAQEWQPDNTLIAAKKVRDQAQAWERIKSYRQQQTTSGVYVPSIDKHLHTDEMSAMIYATIGNAIAAGVYEPQNWKTMEGDFVEMNESLYKELQVLMMQNTRLHYERSEYHKYMMLQADDPLDYDYSSHWLANNTAL